jgi:hypothetical protein
MIIFCRLNSEVSADGRNDDKPLRGEPKSPGIRYTTKENTAIIRNNLNTPIKGRSLSCENLIFPKRYKPRRVNSTIQIEINKVLDNIPNE